MSRKYSVRQALRLLVSVLVVIVLFSCGDDKFFDVKGEIEGGLTQNLRYAYYTGDRLNSGITASRDGKFAFKGSTDQPVMVEIYDNDYRLMGRLYARPGDKIECRLSSDNPYKSSFAGNDINKRYSEFTNANAQALVRSGVDANRLIASYVGTHRDDLVSTMLVVGSYDAQCDITGADSLLALLEPDVRQPNITDNFEFLLSRVASKSAADPLLPMVLRDRRDSVVNFNPAHSRMTLLVISDRNSGRRDSIVPELKKLSGKYNRSQLMIIDYSVDVDTSSWKSNTRPDSATWLQSWGPGTLASIAIDNLGITSVPYFVVADSTGRQLYRGVSLSKALRTIR